MMGRPNLEELDRLLKESQAKKAALSDELNDLIRREAEIADAANEAAAAGDIDSFMAKNQEKDRISAAIFVKRTQLDRLDKPFGPSEVVSAWSDYCDKYNKRFTKKLREYQKASEDLRKQFLELAKMQNALLWTRKRAAELVDGDVDLSAVGFVHIPFQASDTYNVKPSTLPSSDARFCVYGRTDYGEAMDLVAYFTAVVVNRSQTDEPDFIR